jgi:hypothetical protein
MMNALLGECASEKRWMEVFGRSPDLLDNLASEVLTLHQTGKAQSM